MKVITTGIVLLLCTPLANAQTGVGTPPPDGATVLFDGTRETLDANWTYWDGPRLAAELPIKVGDCGRPCR